MLIVYNYLMYAKLMAHIDIPFTPIIILLFAPLHNRKILSIGLDLWANLCPYCREPKCAVKALKGAKSMKDTILAQIMGLKGLSVEDVRVGEGKGN